MHIYFYLQYKSICTRFQVTTYHLNLCLKYIAFVACISSARTGRNGETYNVTFRKKCIHVDLIFFHQKTDENQLHKHISFAGWTRYVLHICRVGQLKTPVLERFCFIDTEVFYDSYFSEQPP
jgi:hypothetical protein